MVLKFASTLVLLSPTIRAVLVSVAVNCMNPLLLTVLREAAPPFHPPFDCVFLKLLPEPVVITFTRSDNFHLTWSSAAAQALVATSPLM